jgi:ubiquinone/menaquinone biosynthesis C-methylase UbiE
MLLNLLDSYPKTKRNISNRLINKELNRKIALKFSKEYFDGDRSHGYGGYKYDGRWIPIAEKIIKHYKLKSGNKVLDVGCAKGFLVKDLMDTCEGLDTYGIDISSYAVKNCHCDVVGRLQVGNALSLPFPDDSFDLVLAINTLHNLPLSHCIKALKEIKRVSKNNKSFIQVDAYSNESQKKSFIDWMLTAKTFGTPQEWENIFSKANYDADYYWTVI